MALRKIHLHGALKERFGAQYKLDIASPLEAIRALCHLLPNFKDEFIKYDYQIVKGELQTGWNLDEETVSMEIGNKDVHFVPHVAGSGGSKGLGKLIAGIVLVGLSFTGIGFAAAGFLGMSTTQLAIMGGILAIGGLAQMNAKTPKFSMSSMEPADRRPSFVFQGAVNTTEQGNAIPLVFGRIRAGSQVVAQGMDTVNI